MRAAKLIAATLCLLLVQMLSAASEAQRAHHDERIWQTQYCAEMQREVHLSYGGYVDCLSPEYAIEVEWSSSTTALKWTLVVMP